MIVAVKTKSREAVFAEPVSISFSALGPFQFEGFEVCAQD